MDRAIVQEGVLVHRMLVHRMALLREPRHPLTGCSNRQHGANETKMLRTLWTSSWERRGAANALRN